MGVLLLAACAPRASVSTGPPPVLHPNLAEALGGHFDLLVGQAPFEVHLWVENSAGYRPEWALSGAEVIEGGQGLEVVAHFTRPGVYYPAVKLASAGRPDVTLSQRIVVLGPEPASSPAGKLGVNQDLAWDAPEVRQPEIGLMRAAGLQWVRLPIRWSWVEPQPDVYAWNVTDPVVDQAEAGGLQVLAVLGSTPAWSSGVSQYDVPAGAHADAYAPRRTSDFVQYVYETVKHYQGRIPAYEMLNEPNSINHWRPKPDAGRFVELLCAGYYAAKYVDPATVIVLGGLNGNGLYLGWESPEGRNFLNAIYDGPGAKCFDVMAIHPYAHPVENGLAELQSWVDGTRSFMHARGDERELWLTEVGWSSSLDLWDLPAISEQQQADWVSAVYRDLAGPQKVFWYNFKETADPQFLNPEYHWGWLHADLSPKPAYRAFLELEGRSLGEAP